MALQIEWRTRPGADAVVVVDSDRQSVCSALAADATVLSKMLTDPGPLAAWNGPRPLEAVDRVPSTWGRLVIARAESGEVVAMDPELFWNGIYEWFRSRGIDYDQVEPGSFAS